LAVGLAKAWMDQQFGSEEKKSEQVSKTDRPPAREKKGKLAPVG